MSKSLEKLYRQTVIKYPYLTKDNFYRILFLSHGINHDSWDSFPDPRTRIEVMLSLKNVSDIPLIVLLKPNSPFRLIDSGKTKTVLYNNEYLDEVTFYKQTVFNLDRPEPFYFFVREINDDIVLKLNPIQLCDFYKGSSEDSPCNFCFRNDAVSRFKNINSQELIGRIIGSESKNKSGNLKRTDEVSIITGTYNNDKEYLREICKLVKGIKKIVPKQARVVVGSHEAKTKNDFRLLKESGVSDYAFPVESFSDLVRDKNMRNRKGRVLIDKIIRSIGYSVEIFGADHVIVRMIAGLGDLLNSGFRDKIKYVASLGPRWNINIYMPSTHALYKVSEKKPLFSVDYLFEYCSIINSMVPKEKQVRFKISP